MVLSSVATRSLGLQSSLRKVFSVWRVDLIFWDLILFYGPYQRSFYGPLLKKDPTTKINTKILKQSKVLKDKEFIDNKLYYYLKPNDSPAPSFYGQQKIHKPEVPIRTIVSYSGFPLYNHNKYKAKILKAWKYWKWK